jgi:uncharacterized protein
MSSTLSRRNTLKLLAAGTSAAAVGLYTWRFEPHWLEFTQPDLPIAGLPKELEGRTLAHVSDIHIGPAVAESYLLHSFERLAGLSPDFIAYTGDWVTYRGPEQLGQLRRMAPHFPHGRLGTVGILGNHDYGFGWHMRTLAQEITNIATAAGITMLRNQAGTFAGLQFLGLDDLWGPYFDPQPLLADKGQDPATIVLCHNPDAADHHPVWGRFQGWILAGHTHGGQCKPPFLPPPMLPVHNKRYSAGPFELFGNRHMYISRGVGHLLQVRFNCRPEIPVFRLRASLTSPNPTT